MDFIIGNNRHQGMLLPDCIEDYVDENNPVRVIDAYVDTLDSKISDLISGNPIKQAARCTRHVIF